ncbi:uncharacterized protein [Procambarus clarkii]|uniref:uncharacterized protein isoform X1 n=1 Tax=Procambarus clarkii TaxID=6728 RepID=UPI001E678E06|nr:uncharacterized protein LOC123771284 isoform X2 [Procambarus clarkii]
MASSNSSQKKHFQRLCPICSNVISVRRHFCNCGHSFIDAKRKEDLEREEKYKEMGQRAAKHQNLCRSFKAIKRSVWDGSAWRRFLPLCPALSAAGRVPLDVFLLRLPNFIQVSKLQGGGYQVAVIYFKVSNKNTTKGMLPGSGLSTKHVEKLTTFFYLAYMQDNESDVNKSQNNDIDIQEDINISEAKEKNGEQEVKLKKTKKKRRLSEDSTIKVHTQQNVNQVQYSAIEGSNQNRKISEAKDKNVEQEDKSLKEMKKQRLSQDTTDTAHQCLLTAEASNLIRGPKEHILEGSKMSIEDEMG